MAQKCIEAQYKIVEFEEKADIYVINTCTVTNMADKKSRQMIRKVKELNSKCILIAVRLLCTSRKRGIKKNTRN